jgi:hypothetical protein
LDNQYRTLIAGLNSLHQLEIPYPSVLYLDRQGFLQRGDQWTFSNENEVNLFPVLHGIQMPISYARRVDILLDLGVAGRQAKIETPKSGT